MLRAHPDNCIRAFHRGRPGCSGYAGVKLLIRHYGGLIPDEIVLKPVMFLKVQGDLCVTERWGNDTWEAARGDSAARPQRPLNNSVADLRKVVFGQAGHFHDGVAVNAVL